MTMYHIDDSGSDFERFPPGTPRDETDISLRAYISRIPADKLNSFQSSWSDEEVMNWDGNFRCDGCLMLVCCERDVDVAEFRRVLHEFMVWRSQHERASLSS
jgi:hypothetical protein